METTEVMVECSTLFGETKLISRNRLVFRPTVYAVLIHDARVLLVTTHSTGKLYLPGGGVELGEKIEEALKREVREETGLEIEILKLAAFKEHFFYYDPLDAAYQSFCFFYLCKPITFDVVDGYLIYDDEAEHPRWVEINSLSRTDFQNHGEVIIPLLNTYGQ